MWGKIDSREKKIEWTEWEVEMYGCMYRKIEET